jgi:hypothetical protein
MHSNVWKDTELWISHALVFFHCIVNSYPELPTPKDKQNYSCFFKSLVHVLPCIKCRSYYNEWLQQKSIDNYLQSRIKLKLWLTQFHNYIHLCLNRPILLQSCEESNNIILKFAKKQKKFMQDVDPTIWKFSKLWGCHAWVFLHAVCNTFPSRPTTFQKTQYKTFFDCLLYILPCKLCQQHYAQWLQMQPVYDCLSSKKMLKQWIFDLHNNVNQRLDKTVVPDIKKGEILILTFAMKNQVF